MISIAYGTEDHVRQFFINIPKISDFPFMLPN